MQIIKINYSKEINEENDKELFDLKEKIVDNNIQFGNCELDIKIPFSKVYFDSSINTMKFKYENGKLIIEYKINKDNENILIICLILSNIFFK